MSIGLAFASHAGANGGEGSAWAITIQPIEIEPGEGFAVRATAFGQGGIPKYVIHLDDTDPPVLRLDSPASMNTNTLGTEVSWQLTALRPGTQTLTVTVDYEKQVCTDPEDPKTCHYQFFYDESPEIKILVPANPGDANCDGTVNSLDAAVVLQYAAGIIDTLPCPDAADVDSDGDTDAIDSLLILQHSAGLLPHF
jgi:hypothetical protein